MYEQKATRSPGVGAIPLRQLPARRAVLSRNLCDERRLVECGVGDDSLPGRAPNRGRRRALVQPVKEVPHKADSQHRCRLRGVTSALEQVARILIVILAIPSRRRGLKPIDRRSLTDFVRQSAAAGDRDAAPARPGTADEHCLDVTCHATTLWEGGMSNAHTTRNRTATV